MENYRLYVLNPLRENISITEFEFLEERDKKKKYSAKLQKIEKELEYNRAIEQIYSAHDILHLSRISIKHIKI